MPLPVKFNLCLIANVWAIGWANGLEQEPKHTAFDYHELIGIKEYDQIMKDEEATTVVSSRIVGGKAAKLGTIPYQVALLILLTTGQRSLCGGSLLSNTKLVTAAHCWWDGKNQGQRIQVIMGSLNLFSGTRVNTSAVEMHGHWDPLTAANDVAIVTIPAVSFSHSIKRIHLPFHYVNQDFIAWRATVSGFGKTSDNTSITTAQKLRFVELEVITNDACNQTYGSIITDFLICTNGTAGLGTCGGDSGGPLAVNLSGVDVLIGVASFVSSSGCESGNPHGYSRVTSFLSWIQERL